MSNHTAAYQLLAESMEAQGLDVAAIKEAIKNHHIETPSWGYANSGTRFKAFPWPGAATTTSEKKEPPTMESASGHFIAGLIRVEACGCPGGATPGGGNVPAACGTPGGGRGSCTGVVPGGGA